MRFLSAMLASRGPKRRFGPKSRLDGRVGTEQANTCRPNQMASGAPIEAARPTRNRRKWGVATWIATLGFYKSALLMVNSEWERAMYSRSKGAKVQFSGFESGPRNRHRSHSKLENGAETAFWPKMRILGGQAVILEISRV